MRQAQRTHWAVPSAVALFPVLALIPSHQLLCPAAQKRDKEQDELSDKRYNLRWNEKNDAPYMIAKLLQIDLERVPNHNVLRHGGYENVRFRYHFFRCSELKHELCLPVWTHEARVHYITLGYHVVDEKCHPLIARNHEAYQFAKLYAEGQ